MQVEKRKEKISMKTESNESKRKTVEINALGEQRKKDADAECREGKEEKMEQQI